MMQENRDKSCIQKNMTIRYDVQSVPSVPELIEYFEGWMNGPSHLLHLIFNIQSDVSPCINSLILTRA